MQFDLLREGVGSLSVVARLPARYDRA